MNNPPWLTWSKTAGIAHGKGMQSYLTMMAVRLLEMRRVLKGHREYLSPL